MEPPTLEIARSSRRFPGRLSGKRVPGQMCRPGARRSNEFSSGRLLRAGLARPGRLYQRGRAGSIGTLGPFGRAVVAVLSSRSHGSDLDRHLCLRLGVGRRDRRGVDVAARYPSHARLAGSASYGDHQGAASRPLPIAVPSPALGVEVCHGPITAGPASPRLPALRPDRRPDPYAHRTLEASGLGALPGGQLRELVRARSRDHPASVARRSRRLLGVWAITR